MSTDYSAPKYGVIEHYDYKAKNRIPKGTKEDLADWLSQDPPCFYGPDGFEYRFSQIRLIKDPLSNDLALVFFFDGVTWVLSGKKRIGIHVFKNASPLKKNPHGIVNNYFVSITRRMRSKDVFDVASAIIPVRIAMGSDMYYFTYLRSLVPSENEKVNLQDKLKTNDQKPEVKLIKKRYVNAKKSKVDH